RDTHHRYPHSFPTRRSSDLKHSPNRLSTQSKKVVCSLSTPTTRTIWPTAPSCLHGKRSIFRGRSLPIENFIIPLRKRYIHSNKRSEEHTSELQSRFDLVCRL